MHAMISARPENMRTHLRARKIITSTRPHIHTYVHVHVHTPTYIRTYIHPQIHTYMHMHTCIHAYMHTHTHKHNEKASMHTYNMYTCIHTHIEDKDIASLQGAPDHSDGLCFRCLSTNSTPLLGLFCGGNPAKMKHSVGLYHSVRGHTCRLTCIYAHIHVYARAYTYGYTMHMCIHTRIYKRERFSLSLIHAAVCLVLRKHLSVSCLYAALCLLFIYLYTCMYAHLHVVSIERASLCRLYMLLFREVHLCLLKTGLGRTYP